MKITRRQPNLEQRNIALTTSSSYFGGAAWSPAWDLTARGTAVHTREALVAAITQAIAADVADTHRFRFKAVALGTGDDITERTPLAYALNEVASVGLSAQELRAHLSLGLDYAGEVYLVEVGETLTPILGGTVRVLAAAPGSTNRDGSPALVGGYVVLSASGRELGRYDGEGKPVSGVAIGQLHRVHIPFPLDPYKADAPVVRAGVPIEVVHYSRLATKAVLQNSGQPAGLIQITDPSVSMESIDAFDRMVNSRLSDVNQKGRTLVVSSDVKFTQLGDSSPGTAWAELSNQARQDVMAVWGMPEARLARGGARTYENQATELAQYYRSVVMARLTLVANSLSKITRSRGFTLEVEYDDVPELAENADAVAARAVLLAQSGLVTVNEAREMLGLDLLDDGDRPLNPTPVAGPPGPEGDTARDALPFVQTAPAAAERAYLPTGTQPSAEEWNAGYDAVVDEHEEILATLAQGFHARIYRNVVGAIRRKAGARAVGDDLPVPAGLNGDDLLDVAARNAELADDLAAPLGNAIGATAARTQQLIGVSGLTNLPRWQIVLAGRISRLVEGVDPTTGRVVFAGWTSTLRNDIADAVRASYAAGESVGELATRIASTLGVNPTDPNAIGERALTIARTEINGLANETSRIAMAESGVVRGKAWYSISDERSRDSHIQAAATYTMSNPIPFDAQFLVGGVMMDRPHDPSAPAAEVVNCRCRLLPVVRTSV
jgi:hypothetical protein